MICDGQDQFDCGSFVGSSSAADGSSTSDTVISWMEGGNQCNGPVSLASHRGRTLRLRRVVGVRSESNGFFGRRRKGMRRTMSSISRFGFGKLGSISLAVRSFLWMVDGTVELEWADQ